MELSRLRWIRRIVGVSAIFCFSQPAPAVAQDASFACKVLLCAAATNPPWAQLPYCVPIMQQAVLMQAWGIAVGICAEARSSASTLGSSADAAPLQNTQ